MLLTVSGHIRTVTLETRICLELRFIGVFKKNDAVIHLKSLTTVSSHGYSVLTSINRALFPALYTQARAAVSVLSSLEMGVNSKGFSSLDLCQPNPYGP